MNSNISKFIDSKSQQLNTGDYTSELYKLTELLPTQLPLELIDLYSKSNGYKDYEGFESIQLWGIEQIIEEYISYKDKHLRFADSMLSVPWISWSLKDGKYYKGYGLSNEYDGKPELLATTFDEVLKLLSEAEILH